MIRILLNTALPGYDRFQAAVLKELKRQRAEILTDQVEDGWRTITAKAA